MVFVAGGFRRRVAFALFRYDVHEDRAVAGVTNVSQHWQEVVEVVPVDRAHIVKSEFFEQRSARPEAARKMVEALGLDFQRFRQLPSELLADIAQRTIGLA